MNRFTIFIGIVFGLCNFLTTQDQTIDIVKSINSIPNIQVIAASDDKNTLKIYEALKIDLKVSGHFNIYADDKSMNITKDESIISSLANKNIDLIAQVEYRKKDGRVSLHLLLYDVKTKISSNTTYTRDNIQEYPFLSHDAAIYINDYVKAPSISWMGGMIVAYEQLGKNNTQVFISDYTMTYKKILFSGGTNLFPKWANADKSEFYYSKITNIASIYKYNIYTGENTLVLSSKGMATVSDVSKDSNNLLLSLAPDGLSDIYLFNKSNNSLKRLTNYSGIDVNANFIDNESGFTFVSDRLGYPTIFKKSFSSNAGVEQLVFQGKNNSSLSSYDNYIVYSSRESDLDFGYNTFNLYLISIKSDYIRRLSKSGTNTIPKFGKDGDTIMYLKDVNNESAIGIIRISTNKGFLFPLKNSKVQGFDW